MRQAELSFHDFVIQGPCEVRPCGTTGSFRAARRKDGLPVLLHRFRPAEGLLANEPVPESSQPPDFRIPFATWLTGVIEAAGSAYLVEPLPVSAPVVEVWREVLLRDPSLAVGFVEALVGQVCTILSGLRSVDDYHGEVCTDNLILTQDGTYGLLAAVLRCRSGFMLLRPAHQVSFRASAPHSAPPASRDMFGLATVLDDMLAAEIDMAVARGRTILTRQDRQTIICVREAVLSAGLGPAGQSARSIQDSSWMSTHTQR